MSSNDTIGAEELDEGRVNCDGNDVDNDAIDDDDDSVTGGCNCGSDVEAIGSPKLAEEEGG